MNEEEAQGEVPARRVRDGQPDDDDKLVRRGILAYTRGASGAARREERPKPRQADDD